MLKRRIPELQVRLAGPLEVEETLSHRRFSLTWAQAQELAAALDFDGKQYMCGAEAGIWRVTAPRSPKLSLTVLDECDMTFNGWVQARGGRSGADKVLLKYDPVLSKK
jgi:hypothetical protein